MHVREAIAFYEKRKSQYPNVQRFMKKFRQKSGGYIKVAKKNGLCHDKELAEPNQRWHFLVSYCEWDGETSKRKLRGKPFLDIPMSRIYGNKSLVCVELLLWLVEAAGCDIDTLTDDVMQLCDQGANDGKSRRKACDLIRDAYPWSIVEDAILKGALRTVSEQ